jgi:ABC-type dipeptide/oligopeptide/nickel transport system ATPase subunit
MKFKSYSQRRGVLTLCIFQIASRELGENRISPAEELKDSIGKGELDALFTHFNEIMDEWKNEPVKLAITGKSGVGKSAFINAICNLKPGDPGFATTSSLEILQNTQLSLNIQEIQRLHYMIYQALEPQTLLQMSAKKKWNSINMTLSLFWSEILKKMILKWPKH